MIQTHILLITVRSNVTVITSGVRIRNAQSEAEAVGLVMKSLKEQFPNALSYDVNHIMTLDEVVGQFGVPLYLNGDLIARPT